MIYILITLPMLFGCMWKDGEYVPDNPVEEIAEGIVDYKLGVDIDFTPGSPEK